jgi:hypothetical protein
MRNDEDAWYSTQGAWIACNDGVHFANERYILGIGGMRDIYWE